MSEPSSLHAIRRRLARLGRIRRALRWLCGLSVLVTASLWLVAAVLLVDILFQLDVLQRVTVLLLATGALCVGIYRFVRPYFGVPETEVDLALLIERLHGIDTDLVAAIEFTEPAAKSWGSATLRGKVINDVAGGSRRFQMARGVDRREPLRKLRTAVVTLVLSVMAIAAFPQHCLVFMRRLALSNDHYPSRTVIEGILVNDQLVLQSEDNLTPRSARCAERSSVKFLVHCTHRPPASGELLITEINGSGRRRVPLKQVNRTDTVDGRSEGLFAADLPTLLDSLEYQVYLGDAWTNPGRVEMLPLPQIELHPEVTPPEYTDANVDSIPVNRTSQLTVLEGSQVDLTVTCSNDKRLQAVWAELQFTPPGVRYEFVPADGTGTKWQLDSSEFKPLHNVQQTVRFTVHALDHDGLSPMQLPTGEVRVQSDLPPSAVTATIHELVLPTARPQVALHVQDDFGIARVRVQMHVERIARTSNQVGGGDLRHETHWLDFDRVKFPVRRADLPLRDRIVLDLAPLDLHIGDRVRVTLEATDYRGPSAGASVMSKPLYLEVSDQATVLAAILEADQRTEKDLDEMIQRQLGLGDAP